MRCLAPLLQSNHAVGLVLHTALDPSGRARHSFIPGMAKIKDTAQSGPYNGPVQRRSMIDAAVAGQITALHPRVPLVQ